MSLFSPRHSHHHNNGPTRRGAASMYVVIFTTILLSIISLSFIRIVLAEVARSSHQDISQSAYDSALAGIEDAKVALLKYHDCLSRGFNYLNIVKKVNMGQKLNDGCEELVYNMEEFMKKESCDTIASVLKRIPQKETGSVMIESSTQSTGETGDSNARFLDQAYTCVKIQKDVKDYRAFLDHGTRARIVPLRTNNIAEMKSIKISWHSVNRYDPNSQISTRRTMSFSPSKNYFPNSGYDDPEYSYRPPTLKVQLFQVDRNRHNSTQDQFALGDLNINNQPGDRANTDRGTLFLRPIGSDNNPSTPQSPHLLGEEGNTFADSADKAINHIVDVGCLVEGKNSSGFMCDEVLTFPKPFRGGERSQGGTFLRISLPYTDPSTDFSIKLCKDERGTDCNDTDFANVQAVVDATGRADYSYRRIESRIEMIDPNFPYPDFAIDAPNADVKKDFLITRNCWTDKGKCNNNKTPADE